MFSKLLSVVLNTLLNFGEIMMPVCYEIINMSITASYIFIAIFLCRLLLKRAPKVYSYILWIVLLFRLLCPISLPSPVSVLNILQLNDTNNPFHMEYVSQEIELADDPAVDLGIPALTHQVNQSLSAPNPGASATPIQIQAFAYTNLWLFGIYGMILYTILSMKRLHKTTSMAIRVEPGVYECDNMTSPFARGLFKTGMFGTHFLQHAIYLPMHLSATEKEVILAHERMHLHRRDPLIKTLYYIALILHWFNPFVWIAFYLMNRDMEMSCDEAVLQNMDYTSALYTDQNDPAAVYCDTLLRMAVQQPVRRYFRVVGPLAFGENSVAARIKHALHFKPSSFRKKMVFTVICGAMIFVCSCNPSENSSSLPHLGYYMDRLTGFFSSSTNNTQEQLWEHRTQYIGDNTAVGNLLGTLEVPEELQIESRGMQLYTSQRPYRLVIRYRANHKDAQGLLAKDSVWIYRNTAYLFALIDNADIIETKISYGENETYYCMMTRFEASYGMGGDKVDLIVTTRKDWDVAYSWIRDVDFRTHGIFVGAYEQTFDLLYTVVTFQSFDHEQQKMLVSGVKNENETQTIDFYMDTSGLVYDEYGDYMLIEELEPGDRLLVGYGGYKNSTSSIKYIYKQKVPDWFARE